ncbi:protein ovarian tumor locus isoform X1 [Drosophila sulfurigaster albostrigata]|uniref:protein ovarian tumor locus isoform X1 n=2 Tax=Drosophila sulfurigaster albostrigata TaxID=89887 RepID=UPI002D21A389|nr:protein ovarian tumor locus isoform X1 [Drosophila sulfurigaster albostrigata]
MLRRPITPGSRQAPDPYDQFLESRAMYRKHTARDASCLFRVIAEQMYDTQMLHFEVRLECVRFMTRMRRKFEQHVRGDFDAYMLDMAKPKTYGTMLELRALCCMYRRNVILFEPFNMGTKVTYNEHYHHDFLVFYTNEFHFDSVYTEENLQMAAICQSICFKLLYKMLFKLPDVNFAVESMLHPQSFNWNSYSVELDARGYISRVVCADGRSFQLDLPEDTICILENSKLCNFHNNAELAMNTADETSNSRRLDTSMVNSTDMLHMCPSSMNSCVRQLLQEGITPFPYKVAKSLDAYMYRNIEFDSWNDIRKEAKRYNIYVNDYNFKVGAKCRVELQIDSECEMYTCHIQKIGIDKSYYIVFVEPFGKKFLVPYEALHPVPPDEFRPWSLPFGYQRQLERVHLTKLMTKTKSAHKYKMAKLFEMSNCFDAGKCEGMQYMQLDACFGYPSHHQQLSAPLEAVEEHQHREREREQRFQSRGKQPRGKLPPPPSSRLQQSQQEQQLPAGQTPLAAPGAPYVNYMPMGGHRRLSHVPWASPHEEYAAGGVYSSMQANNCMFMHFGGYSPNAAVSPSSLPTPPPPYAPSSPPYLFGPQPAMLPQSVLLSPIANRSGTSNTATATTGAGGGGGAVPLATTTTSKHPNGEEQQSDVRRLLHANGEDLPADLSTLRYFYNIGVNTHLGYLNGNAPNQHNNTDQQQKRRNDEAAALMANTSTPPPTPDANATVTGIKTTGTSSSAFSSTEVVDKTPRNGSRGPKRAIFNKGRGKRPEQLYGLNKDNQLGAGHHKVLLPTPTPTPSPNTNGNQFNFYPLAQAPLPPAHQSMSLRPPMFFAAPKAGQNSYGWGLPQPPNMMGMPFEMAANMDSKAQKLQQQQQHQTQAGGYNTTARH